MAIVFAFAVSARAADFETWREALIAGDPKTIAAMIAADRGRLPVDQDGVTVLHKALHIYSANRIEIVQQLIAAGADVNAAAKDGRTPLHWACAFNVPQAVLLLRAGAKIDAPNEDGETPLFAASPETAMLVPRAPTSAR
jgi:ankyrin repeat protein